MPKFIWDAINSRMNPSKESKKAAIPVMDFLYGREHYSLPDILRMDDFWTDVSLRYEREVYQWKKGTKGIYVRYLRDDYVVVKVEGELRPAIIPRSHISKTQTTNKKSPPPHPTLSYHPSTQSTQSTQRSWLTPVPTKPQS